MSTAPKIRLRPVVKGDMGFVLKSWIRSFARSPFAGPYASRIRHKATKAAIAALLQREHCNLVVACNEDNPDILYGFVCYETGYAYPVLHYVYVKELFRGTGIGSALVEQARAGKPGVMRYSFRTQACGRFLQGARFMPGLARSEASQNREEQYDEEIHSTSGLCGC